MGGNYMKTRQDNAFSFLTRLLILGHPRVAVSTCQTTNLVHYGTSVTKK